MLDLFCILVLGWGVLGAGIATVVSQGVSALLCYFYMYKHFPVLKGTADDRKFRFPLAKNLLYIGVPMGLQFSITAIGSILLQSANNALGTACVAAFTAAMRIKMFFICAFESLGIAMATYTGQNYGARKPERIWQGIKASSLLMMIYAVFTFTILMSASDKISLLFVDASETEILKNTVLFLHVSCYFFPILGLLWYPALHHTRRRIHQSGDAFRSFRNDRTHAGQYLCRTDIRILSCLLWRSDRLDSSRPLPRPGIHICLSETEKEP